MPRGKSKPAPPVESDESSSSASYSESEELSSSEDIEEDETSSEDDDDVSSDGSDDGGVDHFSEKPTGDKKTKLEVRGRVRTGPESNEADGSEETQKKTGRFLRAMSLSRTKTESNNAKDGRLDGSEKNDIDSSFSSGEIYVDDNPKKGKKEGKLNVSSKFNLSSMGISRRFGKKKGGQQLGEDDTDGNGELEKKYSKVLSHLTELKADLEGVGDELGKVKKQAAMEKDNDLEEKEELRVMIESLRGDMMKQSEEYSADKHSMTENQVEFKKARTEINDLKEKTVSLVDDLDVEKLKVLELQKLLRGMQISNQNGRKKEDKESCSVEDTLQREIVDDEPPPEHRRERKPSSKSKKSNDRDLSKRRPPSESETVALSKLKDQPSSSAKDVSKSKLRRGSSTSEKDLPSSSSKQKKRASSEKEKMASRRQSVSKRG